MDDPNLKAEGEKWVRHYGCAGCTKSPALKMKAASGTELTYEGSKPIERLDFALFTEVAQRGGKDSEPIKDKEGRAALARWSGERTVVDPRDSSSTSWQSLMFTIRVWSRERPRPCVCPTCTDQGSGARPLHVPARQPGDFPASSYQYRPADTRRDIQEGWWIVQKYNCGAVTTRSGKRTILMGLPHTRTHRNNCLPNF